jgi:imidazolonepropionase-like amidohydrolase
LLLREMTTGFGPVQPPEVADEAQASAAARKLLDDGVDGIKVYAMTRPQFAMTEETIAAAATEAHRRGKVVFAHPTLGTGLSRAVRAGADVIVHTTPLSGPWDEPTLTLMKDKGVALLPTLKLWRYETRDAPASRQQFLTDNGVAQLRSWLGVGGTVLFGTDVGYMQDYDTSEELALMGKAGMDHRQILASLTSAPAQRFGDAKRLGKLTKGFLGDVVVMRGNPADSVEAFSAIAYTVRDGRVIYRSVD